MSFSYDVKNEMCKIRPSGCCKFAQLYGMLLFSRAFSAVSISASTEHEMVCSLYMQLLNACFNIHTSIEISGQKRKMFNVSVSSEMERKKIVTYYGQSDKEIYNGIIKRECCKMAFLRGAFLACGFIDDPNKDYFVEFVLPDSPLSDSFVKLLNELDLTPKTSKRGHHRIVYFKDSDQIEVLLTKMQASHYTLELMSIKIYKDIRNKVNRRNNCETANISKTVTAAVEQARAIEYLEDTGVLYMLPVELVSAAMLRKINPSSSLNELCLRSSDPITRSGLNHRLQKLVAIAKEELENNKGKNE